MADTHRSWAKVIIASLLIVSGWVAMYVAFSRYSPKTLCPQAAANQCVYERECTSLERHDLARICIRTFSGTEYDLMAIWRCKGHADNIFDWVKCEDLEREYWRSK